MTAAWTAPITWTVGELVTANQLNEQIRDNLDYLKAMPKDLYKADEASNYTTSSTSFVSIDTSGGTTDYSLTLDTSGGDVLIGFNGMVEANASTQSVNFDVLVDGSRTGSDDGITGFRMDTTAVNVALPVSFTWIVTGLSAGTHSFILQWKTNTSSVTLYGGAGTANGRNVHPIFWVKEI